MGACISSPSCHPEPVKAETPPWEQHKPWLQPVEQLTQLQQTLIGENERLRKKELDLKEREDRLREIKIEIQKEEEQLKAREESIEQEKVKRKFDQKKAQLSRERLKQKYEWLLKEGERLHLGEYWLMEDDLRSTFFRSGTSGYSLRQVSKRYVERERQEEKRMRDARYQMQMTQKQLKKEEVRLKEEEKRLSKMEKQIVDEEKQVQQTAERLEEKLVWIVGEEEDLQYFESDLDISYHGLKRTREYLEGKEKQLRSFPTLGKRV